MVFVDWLYRHTVPIFTVNFIKDLQIFKLHKQITDSWRLCLVPVNICRDVRHKNGVLCLCQQAARPAVSLKADKYKISRCHLKVSGLLCMAALCISAPDWEETSLWLNTERPSLSTGGGSKKHIQDLCSGSRVSPLNLSGRRKHRFRAAEAIARFWQMQAGSHQPPSSLPRGPCTTTAVSGGRPAYWETLGVHSDHSGCSEHQLLLRLYSHMVFRFTDVC